MVKKQKTNFRLTAVHFQNYTSGFELVVWVLGQWFSRGSGCCVLKATRLNMDISGVWLNVAYITWNLFVCLFVYFCMLFVAS